jgi:hypothetical protein
MLWFEELFAQDCRCCNKGEFTLQFALLKIVVGD